MKATKLFSCLPLICASLAVYPSTTIADQRPEAPKPSLHHIMPDAASADALQQSQPKK